MFSHIYDIYDFSQIPEKFLHFCTFWEETEDVAIVNYRYDTWRGATVAIPIDDYKIDTSVRDNIYIITSGTEVIDFYPVDTGNPEVISDLYYPCKYSLHNLLKHIYPNANVEVFTYVKNPSTVLGLNDIINYINSKSGGKLIFIFSDGCSLYSSDSYQDIKYFLDTVFNASTARNMDTYAIYTPRYNSSEELNNSIESYIYINKPRKVLNFYRYLESVRSDLPDSLAFSAYDHDNILAMYSHNENHYVVYSRNIIKLFSRFVLSNIFHKNREEYYVSLMYNSNPKSAYQQWINRADEYMAEDFHIDRYKHGDWSLRGKYGQTIFKEEGKLVSVGVHTSTDPNIWMCEQGGITCKRESDKQENDLDLMDFWSFFSGVPERRVKPPVFPTTGCPWFTISNKNITDYGLASFGAKLYITRVGSSFILTLRLMHSEARKPDLWQSITFGEFVGRQDGWNIDQFYCAGGNQALSPDSWTYFATSHIIGLQMDLDMKNSSLVNSNILHPAKFEKENMSNFRIMNGEGTWEDIYSATQGYEDYQYLDSQGLATIFTWGVPLKKPNFDVGGTLNTANPYMLWQNKIDTYTINNYDLKNNFISGKIDPLTVYLAK